MNKETGEALGGCIGWSGCVVATIIGNIVFWGALLWVLIQVLKSQGVIH